MKYVKWTKKLKRDQFFLPKQKVPFNERGWVGGFHHFCYDVYYNDDGGILHLLCGTKPPPGWTPTGGSTMGLPVVPGLDTEAVGVMISYIPLKGAKVDKAALTMPFKKKRK